VAAGEVHPQPQLLLFGKAGKAHFYWWDPLPTVAQPPVCKKQHRCCFLCWVNLWTVELVLSKLMNSGACSTVHKFTSMNSVAWLHFSWFLFLEQWSMAPLFRSDRSGSMLCIEPYLTQQNKKKILLIYICDQLLTIPYSITPLLAVWYCGCGWGSPAATTIIVR